MTEFLRSIKSDLLSRRMLPVVAVLGVALLAAIGYALTGGSGNSAPTVPASAASAPAGSAASSSHISVAPENPHVAVSETPGGVRYQSEGPTRDPFTPLASPPEAKSTTTGGSSSSSASSAGGSSSGGNGSSSAGSAGGGTPVPAPAPKKPSKPSKPVSPYAVSVSFGQASSTPGQPATLTPYGKLGSGQPLPSKQNVRIFFERVTSDGKGAVFKLVVPPILHGQGRCLPSTSECQTIDLEAGQSEELEYVEASGQTVIYELKILSIVKSSAGASTASVKRAARAARARSKAHAALVGRKARPARSPHR